MKKKKISEPLGYRFSMVRMHGMITTLKFIFFFLLKRKNKIETLLNRDAIKNHIVDCFNAFLSTRLSSYGIAPC